MGLFDPSKRPIKIEVLSFEDIESVFAPSKTMINYVNTYADGSSQIMRLDVKYISADFTALYPEPNIVKVEFLKKAYTGFLKRCIRMIFLTTLSDGTMALIQAKEGTTSCNRLLAKTLNESSEKEETQIFNRASNVEPYKLNQNELTQGRYEIGKDIPVGTYDFFVVYGSGGSFTICEYDSNNKIAEGTYSSYRVGLKESYENKELIHIECKEKQTIKIEGNVILKIVKSNKVKINL